MEKGKVATVVGLGVSGFGAALLLYKNGWRVKVTEEKAPPELRRAAKDLVRQCPDIKIELGGHTRGFIAGSQLVVTSPGCRDESRPLTWARGLQIPVIDEIELGYRFCPAKIVAVTGTNGKSTTTTLIGEVLKAGGHDTVVCGNIGASFCENMPRLKKDSVVVLEVSSFQLQRIERFRPYASLFLNITQNHFDRHKDFKEYLDAKLNIFKNQKETDWAILGYEDKTLKRLVHSLTDRKDYPLGLGPALSRKGIIKPRILYFADSPCAGGAAEGAYLKDGAMYLNFNGQQKRFFDMDGLPLKCAHNFRNYIAAGLVGWIFKIRPEAIRRAFLNFKGLEHRFEYAARIEGVTFINDSKATTVDAAICAINSLDAPVILIAGGRDKGSDFTVLRNLIVQKVRAVVLIGEAREKIKTQLLGTAPMYEANDLEGAVSLGFDLAKRGDYVLLSPMCASFDMFKNFEERGECFKKAVRTRLKLCITQ